MKRLAFLFLVTLLVLSSCQNTEGQLVGVKNRPSVTSTTPYGMSFIPLGHMLMGSGDQDVPFAVTHQSKNVSISAFWMDETEITNNEYRQFVYWVRDSIAHTLLGEAEISDVGKHGHFLKYEKGENAGEVREPKLINWKEKIPWGSTNEEVQEALSPLYIKINTRFYYYRPVEMNMSALNYEYWWIDRSNHRNPKNPEIYGAATKEFGGSDIGGLYANRPSSVNQGIERFIRREVINVYPDTLCWIHDFSYSYNEPMINYFDSPIYDHYPVVGVSWVQAKAFCHWRSALRISWLRNNGYSPEQDFRLPTEAEWEWAARGGNAGTEYPWGGPYTSTANGCYLSNFKPQRGNYAADGSLYPAIVGHYHPNDFGLFDMSGNVAEWCDDAYDKSASNFTHDLNPHYIYHAKKEDLPNKKRKVIRGGSWKDVSYYIKIATRAYEYQDSCMSFVGFRCVQTYMGRDRGDNMNRASHVY